MSKRMHFPALLACSLLMFSCNNEETTQPPGNHAPTTPKTPSPANGAADVSRSPLLSWVCSDPDAGDSIKYDLYFGEVNPPPTLVASNLVVRHYSITGLDSTHTYYWKVTAKDSKGASSTGPVWRFTTVINIPGQGLVAYYPFNGNANDESGGGWNGTVNGAVLTQDRFGVPNRAYHFTDSAHNTITTLFPGILGSNPRTFSFWLISSNPTHSYSMSYGGGVSPDSAGSIFYVGAQRKTATYGTAYSDLKHGGIAYVFNDSIIIWHHYCVVVPQMAQPRTEDVRIYMDGVPLTVVFYNAGSVVINTLPGLKLVMGQPDSSASFSGNLDDIRVFNRALSNAEIQSLAHEGGW